MQRWMAVFLLVGPLVVACDDGGGPDETPEPDALVRIMDAETDGDPDPDGAAEPEPDLGMEPEPDPDMGLIRDLETCDDICGVYAGCDRLDLWAGERDECLRGCADAELSDRFQGYRSCMQITACDALEECVVPARPRPECPDVCETLDECGASARVPGGLPDVANCATACNNRELAQSIINCGEAVVYEPETCSEPDFARCVLGERQADCLALCDARAGCDDSVDPIDCALDCAQPAEVDDPVARRRQTIARTCAREAADCEELAACGQQVSRDIVGDASVEELCAANEPCAFLEVEACVEVAPPILRDLVDGAIDCLTASFEACDGEILRCFQPATVPLEACDEYCAVSALCGTLPGGQVEFECVQQCRAALASGDQALIAPLRPGLTCAYGDTCADIAACVESAGAGDVCPDYCARVAECGGEVGEGCEADCLARGATARGFAQRSCTLAAGTCEATAVCTPPAPPRCDVLCERLDACDLGGPDCVASCDDADFADPEGFLPRLACVASTARCDERAVCEGGDLSGGDACRAWCRREIECGGAEVDPVDCLIECGEGLPAADGLLFDGARACFEEAGPDAECAALDACVEAVPPDAYCEAFCAATVGCRLAEGNEACIADCRRNAEDPEQIEQAACAIGARRAGAGCAAVAECIGAEVEPASPACQSLCAAQNACDENIDTFLCERDCIPEPEGTPVRAACAQRAGCDELQVCLDAPGVIPMVCDDVCGQIAACEFIGEDGLYPDADGCRADCGGLEVLRGMGTAEALQVCVDGAMCDADTVVACFDVGPAGSCQDAWDAFVVCGNEAFLGLGDEQAYLMGCEQALMADPATTQRQIDCMVEVADRSMGDPLVCAEQIGCLFAP